MQEATSKLQSASGSGSSAGAKRPAAELRNGVDLCSSWRQRAAQYSSLRSPFLVSGLPFEAGSEDVREDTQFHVNHVWGEGGNLRHQCSSGPRGCELPGCRGSVSPDRLRPNIGEILLDIYPWLRS